MRIKVRVTQADIDTGVRISSSACPVAKAIRRVTMDNDWKAGKWLIHTEMSCVTPPVSVRDFIERFDKGEKVEPFVFNLHVPFRYWFSWLFKD